MTPSARAQHVPRPRASQSASTTARSIHSQRVYTPYAAPMVAHQGKTPEVLLQSRSPQSHPPIHPPSEAQHHQIPMLLRYRSTNRLPHQCSRLAKIRFRTDAHRNSSVSTETHPNGVSPWIQTRLFPLSRLFCLQRSLQSRRYHSRHSKQRGYGPKLP